MWTSKFKEMSTPPTDLQMAIRQLWEEKVRTNKRLAEFDSLLHTADKMTVQRIEDFMNKSASDSGYVPYSGALANVDLGARTMKSTSFAVGSNVLDTNEFGFLDGQDQSVKKASNVEHADVKATSFTIGTDTLDTTEFANLNGIDQAVKTNSSVQHASATLSGKLVCTPTTTTATGNQAALSVSGCSVLLFNPGSTLTIQGFANGVTGQILHVVNISAQDVYLNNEDAAGTQKIRNKGGLTLELDGYHSHGNGATLIFDGTYWDLIDTTGTLA